MDAKEAALIAKNYFTEIRGSNYFIFEASRIEQKENIWSVDCEVEAVFGKKEVKKYTILINNEDGTIIDVLRND